MTAAARPALRRAARVLGIALALASLGAGGELDAGLLAVLALVIGGARLAGGAAARLGAPAVVGELGLGLALGNLGAVGLPGADGLSALLHDPQLRLLAELGVILLLFEVGLESNLAQLRRAGGVALAVAAVGVATPMALGYLAHAALAPAAPWQGHLFVGAILTATSVGVTARVLRDLGALSSPTGLVILGAAILDDVLGLVVLAVISGLVVGAASGATPSALAVLALIGKAGGFLLAAAALGPRVSRRLGELAGRLHVAGTHVAAAVAFGLALAWLAHLVGLAPIVGAFAAGLVLDEVTYRDLARRSERSLEHDLRPVVELLAPAFFVLTASQVDLRLLADPGAAVLALGLAAAAVAGKLACALAARGAGVDRLAVGLGMLPRGEVGLIFAARGAALSLGGAPVVAPATFAAVVLVITATTVVTPPVLAAALRRRAVSTARPDPGA